VAQKIQISQNKTYATEANADKAVEKLYGKNTHLRYFIAWTQEGRCYPVFIGASATQFGVHFHFNVVG
jgi:hypothetical protein